MTYISHARTPEELKAEVCSDLTRRISFLENQVKFSTSASEKAKLGRAIAEFIQLRDFWTELQIVRPLRKRASSS
jgi:hypothetical protein